VAICSLKPKLLATYAPEDRSQINISWSHFTKAEQNRSHSLAERINEIAQLKSSRIYSGKGIRNSRAWLNKQ